MEILIPKQVQKVIVSLQNAGFFAYAVGGCVRDSLLGVKPNDWDVTTSATPEEMKKVFREEHVIETGIQHGTLTILIEKMPIEVTTFRIDGDYKDNRHPEKVMFSRKVEDDLARRDFTINAMAYDDIGKEIIDLYDGMNDLQKRTIRAVGNPTKRFEEDGLRILRALRFSSTLDFAIEPITEKAIFEKKCLLENIAKERIREEFTKLLCGKGVVRVLERYYDVIQVFVPQLKDIVNFPQNTKYHCYDVFKHTLVALSHAKQDLITRLSLFYHDMGKPSVASNDGKADHFFGHGAVSYEICKQSMYNLRFDTDTINRVSTLVKIHDEPLSGEEKQVKRLLRIMEDEDVRRLCEIQRCDRLAHSEAYRDIPEGIDKTFFALEKIKEEDACFTLKKLAIHGEDLMALGVPKGKQIGELLNETLNAVIDGMVDNSKETLIEFVKKRLH